MMSVIKTSVPAIRASLKRPGRGSLLAMLALRQIDSSQYKSLAPALRIATIIDALKSTRYFNIWGDPHQKWAAAGQAFIEEGRPSPNPRRRSSKRNGLRRDMDPTECLNMRNIDIGSATLLGC